ncbi:probable UDP-sugar transporter protein SLC35A4 isoform X4 [Struthio camelus]|uniref:probable UDP-sugar transporter protein SLC35A4 isoform X4 n=1 Tax=Struthio camelus TaxID=8801 RepID=UPI00051E1EE3|nr:PREDICTED: probable UDP-sugar transporter protein SLC35A4 isoform X2 [Struthio camelus australis]
MVTLSGNAARFLFSPANWVLRKGLWGLMLILSVAIYGSHAPLLNLCKVDGKIPFSSSSVVVLIELTKLVFSFLFLLIWDRKLLGGTVSWYHVAPFALSALLYAANNNLVVHMQLFMDPSTYQVLSNLKIVSTALLYSLFLRQRLCMQAILKAQALPLSLQNLFLYFFGVLLNVTGHFWSSTEGGFLEGFSSWVLVIVVSQALNGLIMSVVMKHSSNITRLFVISCSILVNALLSVTLFDLQLTLFFFVAVASIGLAVHLYYGVT